MARKFRGEFSDAFYHVMNPDTSGQTTIFRDTRLGAVPQSLLPVLSELFLESKTRFALRRGIGFCP
jgi:hypothetical protein